MAEVDALEEKQKESRNAQEKEGLTKELDASTERVGADIAQHNKTIDAIDKQANSSQRLAKAFKPDARPKKSILKSPSTVVQPR